jgi:L-aspartate oxidase
MGGIVTDDYGATSISGLYAVGETASTGVHGANRLASNSLLECFVFGERLAEKVTGSRINSGTSVPLKSGSIKTMTQSTEAIALIIQEIKIWIQNLTWEAAGICREQSELEMALDQIQLWQVQIQELRSPSRLWIETRNLADFAYLVIKSALFRTESRGAHYRSDYPQTHSKWQVHTVIQNYGIKSHEIA